MVQNNKTRRPSKIRKPSDQQQSVNNATVNRAAYQRDSQKKRSSNRVERLNSGTAEGMKLGNNGRQRLTIQERAQMNKETQSREQMQSQGTAKRFYVAQEGKKSQPLKRSNNSRQTTVDSRKKVSSRKAQKPRKQRTGLLKRLLPREEGAINIPDPVLIEVTLVLLAIGLVMVFSASSYRSILEYGHAWSYFTRQAFFALLGLVAMFIVANMHTSVIKKFQLPMLAICTLLVVATLFVGEESLGATRWLAIGPLRFTPSELTKPFIVLCLADVIKDDPIAGLTDKTNGIALALIGVSWVLIAKEDLGSALTIFGACFAMLIVSGVSKRFITVVLGLGLAAAAAACIAEPYRLQRIFGFLNQGNADVASSSGYQLTQSLYAFGSGGIVGVGIGNSGQKLLYLPGMHTDFIYAVIGEELGLIGAVLVLGLFMIFAWRGFWLAIHTDNNYYSYVGFGISAMIIVQALINMGVAVGVLPITGITLPLISYGGTSIFITLASIGILLNMSRFADKGRNTSRTSARTKRDSRFSSAIRFTRAKNG